MSDDAMMCIHCFHIESEVEKHETELVDGDEFNICPACGEWNCGGYPSYTPTFLWPQDEVNRVMREIKKTMITEVKKR